MKRQDLETMMEDVKRRLEERLNNYKKSLSSTINSSTCSTDLENVSATAVRYATAIAKLESEIQTLQHMMLYIKD